jgi:tungstate transport system substrate-binding protein
VSEVGAGWRHADIPLTGGSQMISPTRRALLFAGLMLAVLLSGCAQAEPRVLRLATTTSTQDSGLLEAILPDFEATHNARVDVVAVGSGQAIELGQNGDADVLLVHSRSKEDAFVADGYGLARSDVMYNDFVLVGPANDPAGIAGSSTAAEALARIAQAQSPFASRGDDSGTHTKEKALWQAAGIEPDPNAGWYSSLGQGMGETLQFANEQAAYTLSDRATYLAQRDNLPNLVILVGGNSIAENPDPALLNPYGVIPVNPEGHEGIQADLAQEFVDWLTSVETQETIAAFGVDRFGQPLFYPDSEPYHAAHP